MVVKINRRGLHEWLVQRITAVIMLVYTVVLFCLMCSHHPLTFNYWQQLFSMTSMKVATILVVFSILWHAWIGLWTVFTDYVKPTGVRVFLEIIVGVLLILYMYWSIAILWG